MTKQMGEAELVATLASATLKLEQARDSMLSVEGEWRAQMGSPLLGDEPMHSPAFNSTTEALAAASKAMRLAARPPSAQAVDEPEIQVIPVGSRPDVR